MKTLIVLTLLYSGYGFSQTEPKLAAYAIEPVNISAQSTATETIKPEQKLAPFSIEATANNKENINVVPVLAPFSIEPVKKESVSEEENKQ